MKTIYANSYNECKKIWVKKGSKFFLLLAIVVPFLAILMIQNSILTDWMELSAENSVLSLLDIFVTFILPLSIFLSATDLFTGEAERGTLFRVLPITKLELFLSKVIAIGIFTLAQLLLVWGAAMISSSLLDPTFEVGIILSSLGSYLLSWIPLMALTMVMVFITQIARSSALGISSMMVFYVVLLFVPYVQPDLLYMLPTAYFDWHMQWQSNFSLLWAIQAVTYLASVFGLFFSISYYMFSRKEA